MSLSWYVRRLGAMSPAEVLHRVAEQVKRSLCRLRSYGWPAFPAPGSVRVIPGLADRLRATTSKPWRAAVRASADKLLDGHFSAHGVSWPKRDPANLFPAEVWRLDPITGGLWPGSEIYCFDLSYRHERRLGDIKYVWELGRLQFLQPLAVAVALWDDARALAAIEQAITSWADNNPPFGGLGWNSGIELALRGVSLSLVVSLCGDRLDPAVRSRVAQVLAAHLYWMHRYPSRFSSANNHLVAEALGEFVIASVLPDAVNARTIGDHARAILEAEAARQILPDGTPAEQSLTYGGFTVEMLLVADLVARGFGKPLAPIVGERAVAYADVVGALSTDGGQLPSLGDDDGGRVLTLVDAREDFYPVSIARAVAGHFGRAPRLPPSTDAPELRDGLFPVSREVEPVPDGLKSLKHGGYTAVRETRAGHRLHLVMDHGPLGYLSIAAHGHADANAVVLTLNDRPVLVDPGTYLYHSGGAWRDWFRGTGSHNTVRLGGVDQSVIAGPFNWSHKANAELDGADDGPEWFIAAHHDGYAKRFGVTHHRRVAPTSAGVAIEDKLVNGAAPASTPEAEVIFQFAPDLTVRCEQSLVHITGEGLPAMTMRFSKPGKLEAATGGEEPGQGGWVSPSFGLKLPAPRLAWSGVIPAEGLRTTVEWA